jgi:hypothetical protein
MNRAVFIGYAAAALFGLAFWAGVIWMVVR